MSLSVPLAQGLLGDTFLNFLLGWGGSAPGTVPIVRFQIGERCGELTKNGGEELLWKGRWRKAGLRWVPGKEPSLSGYAVRFS